MTDPDPLIGPKLKVSRAKRHFTEFQEALQAFNESQPYELTAEVDSRTGEHVYRVRVHKCIPDEFSIIAGDVVHNLRSALDQLICALVRVNRRQVSGSNGFPIMGSAKRFEEAVVGKLKNVSPKVSRLVRRLKPYNGGNSALWLLSELDNMDKHNSMVPVAAGRAQASSQLGMPGLFVSPDGMLCIGGGPEGSVPVGFEHGFMVPDNAELIEIVHDNCEIYRSKFGHLGFVENVQATIEITFGKTQVTDNEPIVTTLEKLISFVDRIIKIVEDRILK